MKNQATENNKKSGLLNQSEPVFLVVGKINKPHGLRGEVSVKMQSDFPDRLEKGKEIFIGKTHKPYHIQTIRKANKAYLISFSKHLDRESVENLRNQLIFTKSNALPPLEENEYYQHELIGLSVVDIDGNNIGVLSEILVTGANDVYVIQPSVEDGKEVLLPAIKDVIKEVNLDNKVLTVKIPEWL